MHIQRIDFVSSTTLATFAFRLFLISSTSCALYRDVEWCSDGQGR